MQQHVMPTMNVLQGTTVPKAPSAVMPRPVLLILTVPQGTGVDRIVTAMPHVTKTLRVGQEKSVVLVTTNVTQETVRVAVTAEGMRA